MQSHPEPLSLVLPASVTRVRPLLGKADIDVFLELSCFFDDPADVGNLISGSSAFSKTSLMVIKALIVKLLLLLLSHFSGVRLCATP